MMSKAAWPGLLAGALGLALGMVALGLDSPEYGAAAGVLALAAGVAGVRVAQQLREQGALQTLVEEELRNVRAQAVETEDGLRRELESTRDELANLVDEDGYVDEPADALVDDATGLYSEPFFLVSMESRIAAARRHLRPVAIVLLEVVEGLPAEEPQIIDERIVADAVRTTLREADTACRLRNGVFGLLLEDTPENGAIWTVERIRRHLAETGPQLTVWAGVACYPAHAFSGDDLLRASERALEAAREWRQDRIEVALVASD